MSYYTAPGEPPGEWAGKGAAALGLSGQVDPGVIGRLYQQNIGPGGNGPDRGDQAVRAGLRHAAAGRRQAQNTRRTKAEARRTVAGQTGAAEPSAAQRLAAWETQTVRAVLVR